MDFKNYEKIAVEKNKSNKFIIVKRFLTEVGYLSSKGRSFLNLLSNASGNIEKFRSVIRLYRNYLKNKKIKNLLKIKKNRNRIKNQNIASKALAVNYLVSNKNFKGISTKSKNPNIRFKNKFQKYTIKNWNNYTWLNNKMKLKQAKNLQVSFIDNF